MRRKSVLLILGSFFCGILPAQERLPNTELKGLYQVTRTYFRSDPFRMSFGDFLEHLINDPDLHDKVTQKRTDSTLFSFSGTFTTYNPFFFRPERVAIVFKETPVRYTDSLHTIDTVFLYQLQAFTGNDDKSIRDVKKEFEKIHRQNHKKFFDSKYQEEKRGGETGLALYNYFVALHWLSPFTIAWARLPETAETALVLTLRLKRKENSVVLPGDILHPE